MEITNAEIVARINEVTTLGRKVRLATNKLAEAREARNKAIIRALDAGASERAVAAAAGIERGNISFIRKDAASGSLPRTRGAR